VIKIVKKYILKQPAVIERNQVDAADSPACRDIDIRSVAAIFGKFMPKGSLLPERNKGGLAGAGLRPLFDGKLSFQCHHLPDVGAIPEESGLLK
jgi:hypothetical protein